MIQEYTTPRQTMLVVRESLDWAETMSGLAQSDALSAFERAWIAATRNAIHLSLVMWRGAEYTYLLHFEDQHGHAQHLLWWTDYLPLALLGNHCGFGPGLIGAFQRRGVRFEVVGIWEGGAATRRELRRKHNNRRLCPRCLYGRARQLKLPYPNSFKEALCKPC